MSKSKTVATPAGYAMFANVVYLPRAATTKGRLAREYRPGYVLFRVDASLLDRLHWTARNAFPKGHLDGATFRIPGFPAFHRGRVNGMPPEGMMRVDNAFVASSTRPMRVAYAEMCMAFTSGGLLVNIEGYLSYHGDTYCRHVESVPFEIGRFDVPELTK